MQRWLYTGVARPALTYGALVWVKTYDTVGKNGVKQTNRLSCLWVTLGVAHGWP